MHRIRNYVFTLCKGVDMIELLKHFLYFPKNKKGMGLGIFISKNLIENMKGSINFYNSSKNNAVVAIKFQKDILI